MKRESHCVHIPILYAKDNNSHTKTMVGIKMIFFSNQSILIFGKREKKIELVPVFLMNFSNYSITNVTLFFLPYIALPCVVIKCIFRLLFSCTMNSLDFCATSSGPAGARAGYPLRTVNSMLFDLHHQMAEQYHVYSAASPAVHTLSVAERLAGGLVHCCS